EDGERSLHVGAKARSVPAHTGEPTFRAPHAGPGAPALRRSDGFSPYAVAYDAADPPSRTARQRPQCQRPDRLRAAVDLVRVLPAEGREGRAAAVDDAARA